MEGNRKPEYYEDEIELMDYLRVIWKRKYLIAAGTLICAVVAGVISFSMPEVYRIDMVVRTGILTIAQDGQNVYIDSVENIKATIETGTYDSEILNNIGGPNTNDVPKRLGFNINIPRGTDIVKVVYETSNANQGLHIMNNLGRLLLERYGKSVKYHQIDYDIRIQLKSTEVSTLTNKMSEINNNISAAEAEYEGRIKQMNNKISNAKARREARKNQINNLQERILSIELEVGRTSKNTDILIEQRNRLLSSTKNEDNILSSVIYSNTIQQNIAYLTSLKSTINNLHYQVYEERVGVEISGNNIKDLKAEKECLGKQTKCKIENLKSQIRNVEIKKGYTLEEIKSLELKKNSIQNIQILQHPTTGPSPIKPKMKLNVMLATVVGLFAMLFLAFFLEYIQKHKGELRS